MIEEETMIEDHEHAAPVLDKAIAKVFRQELERLSQSLSDPDKANKRVDYAINELDKLGQRQSEMPKYDAWVAPFYLSWYQGSQINLAYSMARGILTKESISKELFTDTGRLYVLDFGCGALVMKFGIALAIADALQDNQKIHSACVVSYDESEAMKNIGRKVWKQFRSEVSSAARKDASLSYLEQACELIDTRTDRHSWRPLDNEIVWLSAIHTAYNANKNKVKKTLAWLTDEIRPSAGVVTSHVKNEEIVNFISPFHHDEYEEHHDRQYDVFRGELPETTKARGKLLVSLQRVEAKTMNYLLNKPVTWEWRSIDDRIYTRRQ